MKPARRVLCLLSGIVLAWAQFAGAETFRVATYNVENYLDSPAGTRHAKSEESKAIVRASIRAIKPDVLALQEMGSLSALEELRASLKKDGLDFPHWIHVTGFDTNIHVVVLSRFPFKGVRYHTNDSFLLDGRRFHVSRGFGEVQVQVTSNYVFTLLNAHLKSQRPIPQADQAELRLEEAKVLREKVEELLAHDPNLNLVVLGDLNDNKNAKPIREVIGRGKNKLADTRPGERDGNAALPKADAHQAGSVAWTHFYALEDLYSRLDYILLSRAMARHWLTNETYVLSLREWAFGSDHRPVVAAFETGGD